MEPLIPRQIVPSPVCSNLGSRRAEREFRRLIEGGLEIRPAGKARRNPLRLLSLGYSPKHAIELFDTTYYVSNAFQNYFLRFFVAYIVQGPARTAHPRIFYKDASLIWRSASHFARSESENWIGKGDLKWVREHGQRARYTAEETTNLPFEIQAPLDADESDALDEGRVAHAR